MDDDSRRVSIGLGPALAIGVIGLIAVFWVVRWIAGIVFTIFKIAVLVAIVGAVAWLWATRKRSGRPGTG